MLRIGELFLARLLSALILFSLCSYSAYSADESTPKVEDEFSFVRKELDQLDKVRLDLVESLKSKQYATPMAMIEDVSFKIDDIVKASAEANRKAIIGSKEMEVLVGQILYALYNGTEKMGVGADRRLWHANKMKDEVQKALVEFANFDFVTKEYLRRFDYIIRFEKGYKKVVSGDGKETNVQKKFPKYIEEFVAVLEGIALSKESFKSNEQKFAELKAILLSFKNQDFLLKSHPEKPELITHGFKSPRDIFSKVFEIVSFFETKGLKDELVDSDEFQEILLLGLKFLYNGRYKVIEDAQMTWNLSVSSNTKLNPLLYIGSLLSSQFKLAKTNTLVQFYHYIKTNNHKTPKSLEESGYPRDYDGFFNATNINNQKVLENMFLNHQAFSVDLNRPVVLSVKQPAQQQVVNFLMELQQNKNISDKNKKVFMSVIGAVQYVDDDFFKEDVGHARKKRLIGRDDIVNDLITILEKKERFNTEIVGDVGVGLTTFVELFARRLHDGEATLDSIKSNPIILKIPAAVLNGSVLEPSKIPVFISLFKKLSEVIQQRVIVFVDNADELKPEFAVDFHDFFSTKANNVDVDEFQSDQGSDSRLNFVFLRNSGKKSPFADEKIRHLVANIEYPEMPVKEAKNFIKLAHYPGWIDNYFYLGRIEEEVFEYAEKYYKLDQGVGAKSSGIKSFIESVISFKNRSFINDFGPSDLKADKFVLSVQDMMDYIEDKVGTDLLPGSKNFNKVFDAKIVKFKKKYIGQDAHVADVTSKLKNIFDEIVPDKQTMILQQGPPGSGKTYFAEILAEVFADGRFLNLKMSKYSTEHSAKALNGAEPSFIGYEDGGILTNHLQKNEGKMNFVLMDEADNMHESIWKMLLESSDSKSWYTNDGKKIDISKTVFILNTNVGQELVLPSNVSDKISFDDYEKSFKGLLVEKSIAGKDYKVVPDTYKEEFFLKFNEKIFNKSNRSGEKVDVATEALKSLRRFILSYTLPPGKKEVYGNAHYKKQKFIEMMKLNSKHRIEISDEVINYTVDIENFNYYKNHSDVVDKMNNNLFIHIKNALRGELDKDVKVTLADTTKVINKTTVEAKNLVVSISGVEKIISLGSREKMANLPWANETTIAKIESLAKKIRKKMVGQNRALTKLIDMYHQKRSNHDVIPSMVLLGPKQNGKTHFAHMVAENFYGSKKAIFKFENILTYPEFKSHFDEKSRDMVGVKSFKNWLHENRVNGGVILFSDLMTFSWKSPELLGHTKLMIDDIGQIMRNKEIVIGKQKVDLRNFTVIFEGNEFSDFLDGDPGSKLYDLQIKRFRKRFNQDELRKQLARGGFSEKNIASLGDIIVEGKLSTTNSEEVIQNMIDKDIEIAKGKFGKHSGVEVVIPEEFRSRISRYISEGRLSLAGLEGNLETLVLGPVNRIIGEFDSSIKDYSDDLKIEMKINQDGHISWFFQGKEILFVESFSVDDDVFEQKWVYKSEYQKGEKIVVPQFKQITGHKTKYAREMTQDVKIHEIIGHWLNEYAYTKENSADLVTIEPKGNYLGAVYPKDNFGKVRKSTTLSDTIIDMVVLQAGHLAPMITDNLHTYGGGGPISETDLLKRNDDLGKVERHILTLLRNEVIANTSAFKTDKEVHDAFRSVLVDLSKGMSAYTIHKGKNSGEFEKILDDLGAELTVGEDYLDDYVKGIDYQKISKSQFHHFFESISETSALLDKKYSGPGFFSKVFRGKKSLVKDAARLRAIKDQIISQSLQDLISKDRIDEANRKDIISLIKKSKKLNRDIRRKVALGMKNDCNSSIRTILGM